MVLGPLEYLVVGFEKYRFTGQILAELRAAQEKGIIRVVDLCVIAKDEQGNVTERELSELSGEEATELSPLAGNVMGLLADEDIQQLAADIPNDSAAGSAPVRTYLGHRLERSDQACGCSSRHRRVRFTRCARRVGNRPRDCKAKRWIRTTNDQRLFNSKNVLLS